MPRCKNCKEKFEPKHFNQKFCLLKDECLLAHVEYSKLQQRKSWQKEKREKSPELYPKEHKASLQREINKLSRMIDTRLGYDSCIDCGETLIGIGQIDAAHFYNKKNHGNIRYNLHNIHSARSECNRYSDTHKEGYRKGIIKRYSKSYMDRIDGLDLLYKGVKLTNKEVTEKLALVRKINRDFGMYKIENGIIARDMFNNLIGIYTEN